LTGKFFCVHHTITRTEPVHRAENQCSVAERTRLDLKGMGFGMEWVASLLVFFITSTTSEIPVPARGV
jgi:hypothetical protein